MGLHSTKTLHVSCYFFRKAESLTEPKTDELELVEEEAETPQDERPDPLSGGEEEEEEDDYETGGGIVDVSLESGLKFHLKKRSKYIEISCFMSVSRAFDLTFFLS